MEIVTKKECAKLLKICERSIDSLRAREHDPIPALKIGTSVRFSVADVLEWLQRQGAQK